MRKVATAALLAAIGLIASATFTQAQDNKSGEWTTIKGKVTLAKSASVPAMKVITPTADKEMCLAKGPFSEELWVVHPKNGGIQNVFVWIEPAENKRGEPFPSKLIHPKLAKPSKNTVEIDQPCCKFEPHVLAVREGQDLLIKNSAPKAHNAKFESRNNGSINPLLPAGASHTVKSMKSEKFPIELGCNIHPWMKAWIRVYDHPYFAVTDENGEYEIKMAPQGKFKLYVWHESGFNEGAEGAKGKEIKIEGATMDLPISFTPTK